MLDEFYKRDRKCCCAAREVVYFACSSETTLVMVEFRVNKPFKTKAKCMTAVCRSLLCAKIGDDDTKQNAMR